MAVKKASKRKGLMPTMCTFIDIPPDVWKLIISFWKCGQGIKYIKSNVFTGIFYMFSSPKETETKYRCNKDICAACGLSCIYWPYKDPYNIALVHNHDNKMNFNDIERKPIEKKIRVDISNINISTNGIVISCGKKNNDYYDVCSQECAQMFLYRYLIKEVMEKIVKSFHEFCINDYFDFLGSPYEFEYRHQMNNNVSNSIQFDEEYSKARDNILKLENSKMLSSAGTGFEGREHIAIYNLEYYRIYLYNMAYDIIRSDIIRSDIIRSDIIRSDIIRSDMQSQSTLFKDFEYYLNNYIKIVDNFTLF